MAHKRNKRLPSQLTFPVVGLGASAGGLDALGQFFEALPERTGAAYVIVVHLSPDHVSHLAELLSGTTRMPVVQVLAATHIEPNHVYVIAPSLELTMVDSMLRVAPKAPESHGVAIDMFFRSLAEVHGARAVAIVLSGAGSDGALGASRVKECGGITIAQSPQQAEHDSMPLAAINTGAIDLVLPVDEMPARLQMIWSAAKALHDSESRQSATGEWKTPDSAGDDGERALREIMTILRTRTTHDFRHYKRATVMRRVERRIQVNGLTSLAQYRDFLHLHPNETPLLLQDMLISVTNFFRDKEAFEALRGAVLPELFRNRTPEETVRTWTVGCATGEEAYTLAMLLQEASSKTREEVPFQVFATDIDERAVMFARQGLYPEPIFTDVDAQRLRQFFIKDTTHYKIKKELRERILFALHNVLTDPPFSRLDVISCRNLLIYLDREAQINVLHTFHFALRPGGYLFLGSSEAADSVSHLFSVVDKKARIYRANVAVRVDPPMQLSSAITHIRPSATLLQPAGKRKFSFGDLHQRVVEQYAPPSVLVNRDSEIVHLSDRAGRFLHYAGGEPSHNIIGAVRPELRVELRTAIFQTLHAGHSVEARRVRSERDGRTFFVTMIARPVHDTESHADFVLVVFDEVEESLSEGVPEAGTAQRDPAVAHLEAELQRTKDQLQTTVEQAETSTEELKASNEELQAINEELRSATEELETSKEELQSINEELTTVNAELKSKVEETAKINDDLQNLITANDIGTIFVDRTICIKRYTPRATAVFNIIPSDIGRSLLDITHRLEYEGLGDDAAAAFDTLRLIERELRSTEGRWYLARFLPYRTTEDRIEGAVLSFIDITSRKQAEERLHEGERRMKLVAESTRDYAIITFDDEGLVTGWNPGAGRIFGYTEAEALGMPAAALFTLQDRERGVPELEMNEARKEGRVEDERSHLRKDGSVFRATGVLSRMDKDGIRGFAKILRNLDEVRPDRKGVRRFQQNVEKQRNEFLAVVSHELKQPLNLISANAELIARSHEARRSPLLERAVRTIQRTVIGQAQIIDDLLDLSRLRTGKLSITHAPIDLTETVKRITNAVEEDSQRNGLTLNVALPDEPVFLHADSTRIDQIIWNLISNAMKFTGTGGRVDVRLETTPELARLIVADTGVGIDSPLLPHVFEMFRQGGYPAAAKGGLGIGLSLVKELVNLHHGNVSVASEGAGKGAVFTVELPREDGIRVDQNSFLEPGSALQARRILVVDDDEATVETFKILLESEGAEVRIATGGREALRILEDFETEFVLSDIGMPGMDGLEFMAELRTRPQHRHVKAVAMTGFGRADDVEAAARAGFDAHLAKPIVLDALLATLARLQVRPKASI